MSLYHKDRVDYDFGLRLEFGNGLSNGVHYKIVLFANRTA